MRDEGGGEGGRAGVEEEGDAWDDPEAARLLSCSEACCKPPDAGDGAESQDAACEALMDIRIEIWQRWSSKATNRNVQHRAKAVNRAIDALLKPILDEAESRLDSTSGASWDTATMSDLIDAILESRTSTLGRESEARVCRAVSHGFDGLCALFEPLTGARRTRKLKCCFYNISLNRIASMMTTVTCRKVILEDQGTIVSHRDAWRGFCKSLHLCPEHITLCMQPTSKSLFAYLDTIADYGQRKVTLKLHRARVLEDSSQDIVAAMTKRGAARDRNSLPKACKLFPFFYETSGGDNDDEGTLEQGEGHGPRREFFQLVGQCASSHPSRDEDCGTDDDSPKLSSSLLVYRRSAGAYWINTDLERTSTSETYFSAFGWLAGQCLHNRCTLGIPLPGTLFSILLHGAKFVADEAQLCKFDPEAARSLRLVNDLPDRDFRAMLALDDLDQGTTRNEYIAIASKRILCDEVRWQTESMRRGFDTAMEIDVIVERWKLDGDDLADIICGNVSGGFDVSAEGRHGSALPSATVDFSIEDVFRVVLSDDIKESTLMRNAVLATIRSLSSEQKTAFVTFVTGTPRLPEPRTEILKVETPFVPLGASERRLHIGMLPQAHTCENELEMPDYNDALIAHVEEYRAKNPNVSEADATVRVLRELADQYSVELTFSSGNGDEGPREDVDRLTVDFLEKLLKRNLLLAAENCVGYQLDE